MLFNILLIGAGQLGSRHLQGLSKFPGDNFIYIIDPSEDSLRIAEARLNEVSERNLNNKYFFKKIITDLPAKINLTVIATNADIRKNVLDELITLTDVDNIVLEKFLFQTESEFYETEELLNKKKINAWVNCPRRMYPEFIELKNNLLNKKIKEINITGTNWSLGSNAIHFIDIFSFLLNSNEYTITDNFLLNHIFENKRPGFIEFNGKLKGRFKNNTFFNIACLPGNVAYIEIEILLEDEFYLIKQAEQKLLIQRKQNHKWVIDEKEFPVYFQSNLTNVAVKQILHDGRSELPSYNESMKLHLPLLKVFTEQLRKIHNKIDIDRCPIT